ncbi:hypothetical protein [Flavobacterium suzhouense]|uniref:DUF4468 domain-containing protein n=1 Tax=Flavobacterium suzhouense TaxID=1529638 RepID=A0ABW5NVZ4_9FLAO
MQKLFCLLCFFIIFTGHAQAPVLELTPKGFDAVEGTIPTTANEKLIELSKMWAAETNLRIKGYDASNVTSNSMVISAFKKNAFFLRNKGETFNYNIAYSMKLSFHGNYYSLHFVVNDIYTANDVIVKYKLPDYFDNDGDLKDGYDTLKPSLERSVNEIVRSYHNFLVNYR